MTHSPTVKDVLGPLLAAGSFVDFGALWKHACRWPPDAFAIAHILLSHHAIYRAAVSTEEISNYDEKLAPTHRMGGLWPNQQAFVDYVRAIGGKWRKHANELAQDKSSMPAVDSELEIFFKIAETELLTLLNCARNFSDAKQESVATLFCLAASADEACVGLGLPGPPIGDATFFELEANSRLIDPSHASLSTLPCHIVRVLPKSHTPQRGLTIRSLSHHVCATTHDFGISWHVADLPVRTNRDERLNLLLFPWPLAVDDRTVRPAPSYDTHLPDGWGYFDFSPPDPFDAEMVSDLITSAMSRRLHVDGVVLPESAVTQGEADDLVACLERHGIGLALLGVRGPRRNVARLYVDGYQYEQCKHHRWCLDRPQIERYQFQRSLNPHINWWENIHLGPRDLRFTALSSWLTLCHVICEDLARLDPVDQLIRSVAPNLLLALLQDGPQLKDRWGARYAAVYSDDPGTSVLTLTSLGMAMASRVKDKPPSRCVALWSDPDNGTRELVLEENHEGIWLSICGRRVTEFTADGRSDAGMGARLVLVDHQSVRR